MTQTVNNANTEGISCIGIGGRIWDTFGDPADFLATPAAGSDGGTCLFLASS